MSKSVHRRILFVTVEQLCAESLTIYGKFSYVGGYCTGTKYTTSSAFGTWGYLPNIEYKEIQCGIAARHY